ncbi:MAG TPA: hypothetical protein VKV16_10735 [Solirubrobacteraceae bacterium]|nr:hypothetical protein [Solirubrobacteraceae bacterium]
MHVNEKNRSTRRRRQFEERARDGADKPGLLLLGSAGEREFVEHVVLRSRRPTKLVDAAAIEHAEEPRPAERLLDRARPHSAKRLHVRGLERILRFASATEDAVGEGVQIAMVLPDRGFELPPACGIDTCL